MENRVVCVLTVSLWKTTKWILILSILHRTTVIRVTNRLVEVVATVEMSSRGMWKPGVLNTAMRRRFPILTC